MANSTGTILNGNQNADNVIQKVLEAEHEMKERKRSLLIVYFTLFLQSLGLAIVMTGIWPFLDKLDPLSGKTFMSFIVAANPLGQFVFSPLLGYWTNKLPSIRLPIVASLIVFCVSNVLYASLDIFGSGVKYWMLIARFFTGAASANIAVCRSYIAASTKLDERTHALSMASLAQVSGFIAGPLLQALFTLLDKGFVIFDTFHISMYTMPGYVSALFGALNIALMLPCMFQDRNIAAREQMMIQGKENEKETWKSTKVDYVMAWILIFSYFIVALNLVILESLGTPLTMDQFAFTRKETIYWNSILVGVGAFISCVIFCLLPRVCKIFKEVDVLIWAGFLVMAIGKFVYIPFRDGSLKLAAERNYTMPNGTVTFYDDDHPEVLGCPVKTQEWCAWTPQLGIPEFVIGYFLGVIGYPIGVTLIQTIFSKILGSRPQGTWMGVMLSGGSLCRIIGPVIIVSGYTNFGTIWTFSITTLLMLTPIIWFYVLRKRLIPETAKKENNNTDDMIQP